jgi:hypothetical protein
MSKLFILLISLAAITLTAKAGDLYKVEKGSYVSTDFQSLNLLLHTQHGTNRYRAIRDVLISQGTLIPCDSVVEVIIYRRGYFDIIEHSCFFDRPIACLIGFVDVVGPRGVVRALRDNARRRPEARAENHLQTGSFSGRGQ